MNDEQPNKLPTVSKVLIVICLIPIAFLVFALLFPGPVSNREASRSSQSKNHLKQIGLALHSYHEMHEMFPPGKIVMEGGEDYQGWPAILLPFLDQAPLHDSLDFDQPFDAAKNTSIFQHAELIQEFQNPMSEDYAVTKSNLHYALNSLVFQPNRGFNLNEATDGTSQTFMAGEISEGLRPWYEPGHLRDPAKGFNKGPETFGSPYFGQKKYKGVHMLMMDGSVRAVPNEIDVSILKALATPAAGDDPGDF